MTTIFKAHRQFCWRLWFQIKHFEESPGLIALSANFTLYGDLSDRMMILAAG